MDVVDQRIQTFLSATVQACTDSGPSSSRRHVQCSGLQFLTASMLRAAAADAPANAWRVSNAKAALL